MFQIVRREVWSVDAFPCEGFAPEPAASFG